MSSRNYKKIWILIFIFAAISLFLFAETFNIVPFDEEVQVKPDNDGDGDDDDDELPDDNIIPSFTAFGISPDEENRDYFYVSSTESEIVLVGGVFEDTLYISSYNSEGEHEEGPVEINDEPINGQWTILETSETENVIVTWIEEGILMGQILSPELIEVSEDGKFVVEQVTSALLLQPYESLDYGLIVETETSLLALIFDTDGSIVLGPVEIVALGEEDILHGYSCTSSNTSAKRSGFKCTYAIGSTEESNIYLVSFLPNGKQKGTPLCVNPELSIPGEKMYVNPKEHFMVGNRYAIVYKQLTFVESGEWMSDIITTSFENESSKNSKSETTLCTSSTSIELDYSFDNFSSLALTDGYYVVVWIEPNEEAGLRLVLRLFNQNSNKEGELEIIMDDLVEGAQVVLANKVGQDEFLVGWENEESNQLISYKYTKKEEEVVE